MLNIDMNQEKFDLTWHTYTDHLRQMLHDMMTYNELTDVTLVSEDKKHFKAHKVVLSSSSTVFKNIISDNNTSNPVIYLRGILSDEIESILQFIYLGQATIYQERMNEFLDVGKSLEINEISKDIESSENELPDIIQSNEFEEKNRIQSSQLDSQQLSEIVATKEEIINSSHRNIVQDNSLFSCDQCQIVFRNKYNLNIHTKSNTHIKGIKYPCYQCNFKANHKSSLARHIRSTHDGPEFERRGLKMSVRSDLVEFWNRMDKKMQWKKPQEKKEE